MIIEAENLKDAYNKAAAELGCSVTQLNVRVLQHPSSGFLGFFKKNAVIEAVLEGEKFSEKSVRQRKSIAINQSLKVRAPRILNIAKKSKRAL